MPITNKFNLPEALFSAIANDDYASNADISVTELIGPPQIRVLKKRHKDKIDTDITEMFWAACGKAMHKLLAQHTQEGAMSERRMTVKIGDWTLSGQLDLYDPKTETLSDYKFVGQYSYKMASTEGKNEWSDQVNIYRWLLWKTEGIEAKKLEIVCLLRDWMQSKAGSAGYPPIPVGVLPQPVYEFGGVELFIADRMEKHRKAEALPDEELPGCTDEERWFRNGRNLRCLTYCPVRSVCHQNNKGENS